MEQGQCSIAILLRVVYSFHSGQKFFFCCCFVFLSQEGVCRVLSIVVRSQCHGLGPVLGLCGLCGKQISWWCFVVTVAFKSKYCHLLLILASLVRTYSNLLWNYFRHLNAVKVKVGSFCSTTRLPFQLTSLILSLK